MSTITTTEWPYTVELTDLADLFADSTYQRPILDAFVNRLAASFDPTLVGVLDVSARDDGRFAIMDGLQRYSAIQKVAKTTAYCAIYTGMSVQDEATFFYRKNKDRRNIHPYYSFRARIVSGDAHASAVERIVGDWGFKLHPNARGDENIAAVTAAEDAYSWGSLARTESLSGALKLIKNSFFGRQGAKEGDIIRGLARLMQPFSDDEIDLPGLYEVLEAFGPRNLIGKAKDTILYSGAHQGARLAVSDQIARDVLKAYNRGRRTGKLSPALLHTPK